MPLLAHKSESAREEFGSSHGWIHGEDRGFTVYLSLFLFVFLLRKSYSIVRVLLHHEITGCQPHPWTYNSSVQQ